MAVVCQVMKNMVPIDVFTIINIKQVPKFWGSYLPPQAYSQEAYLSRRLTRLRRLQSLADPDGNSSEFFESAALVLAHIVIMGC